MEDNIAAHNTKHERNARLLRKDKEGLSLRQIAKEEGLSAPRVGQILLRLRGRKVKVGT